MLGSFITKDITSVYGIEKISDDGIVVVNKKEVAIYRVNPVNIIAWDSETKQRIISSYIATLRGMPETFQIVVTKEKSNLKNDIEQYKKRLLEVENYGLKMALKKYVDYLVKLENENGIYEVKHYLIVEPKNNTLNENIKNAFSNMNEFGIDIRKITKRSEVETVLRRAMK